MSAEVLEDADAVDPVTALRKSLGRWRFMAIVSVLLAIATIGGSVMTVWYTGSHSLTAFKDLPTYQVNTLTIDYRDVVKRIDASHAGTVALVSDNSTQYALYDARELSAQVLDAEQQLADDIRQYADSVTVIASDIGGALEWNRHFQRQAKQLVERSQARLVSLQAFYDRFPVPRLPELEAEAHESAEQTAPSDLPSPTVARPSSAKD